MELTGKRRYRIEKHWCREYLVLEVEERGLHTYCVGGMIDTEYVTRWRDAKISDLTEHERPDQN